MQWLKSPSGRRVLRWTGLSWLILVLLGGLMAPPLIKSMAIEQLERQLKRQVSIEHVAFNPLALSLTVDGLSVRNSDGSELAGFAALKLNISSTSLFKWALVLDAVRLDAPRLSLVRLADGQYDIDDLLAPSTAAPAENSSGLPRFSLNNIEVSNGQLQFDDRPNGRVHQVAKLDFALPFISSLPYQADIFVQPKFSAEIDGAAFSLDGHARPFGEGRQSALQLDLAEFDLARLQPYVPAAIPLELTSGRLGSRLKVLFDEQAAGVFSLGIEGDIQLSDLRLRERQGGELLAWQQLAIGIEHFDPLGRQLAMRQVTLDGPALSLTVDRAGELNLLRLMDRLAASAGKKPAKPAEQAPPLAWSIKGFTLQGGRLRWADASHETPIQGQLSDLNLQVGAVESSLKAPIEIAALEAKVDFGERLRVDRLALNGVRIDLPGRRIDVAELSKRGTRLAMQRDASGAVQWLQPPRLKPRGASDDGPAWLGEVAKLAIDDLALRFEDHTVQPAVVQQIERFSLQGEKLGNVPGQRGSVQMKSTVNRQGALDIAGEVQGAPFAATLRVDSRAIPLDSLQGYVNQYLNARFRRGQFSSSGKLQLQQADGPLQVAYQGDATLGNLRAVDLQNDTDFLKWKSLYFGGIDFRLAPLALEIREIALNDFFSRLILDASGRLNLADLLRRPEAVVNNAAAPAERVEVAATPEAPAVRPPIRIGKVSLNNGKVNFSDYFVKPNYTVDVDRLGGRINGLSSAAGSVADLELLGRYGVGAPVRIAGRINPLAADPLVDLKAEIKGVDLTGLSTYSGKYAGYAIDKGKLSLDLAYKLENRQLTAENHLFIDQFTFGEKVDSPDATSLPVSLAIALLKNNRGEIDLNLPISGSLDDPQFSLGGLVLKVIVNLFVKAVTSPFALLGSMFGGEELSTVAFAPGQSEIDPAAAKLLGNLATALGERSGLKLEITGRTDDEADRVGLQQVALRRAVRREKLAELRARGGEVDASTVNVSTDEYPRYLTRAYRAAKFPKPRNFVGLQKDLPVSEMEKLLLTNLPASDDDLRLLARARAERVQAWLVEEGKVAPERIFLVPPKAGETLAGHGGRVDFSLR